MGSKQSFYANVTALHPEVTGSCIFVDVHYPDDRQTKFIVDCGLFQEQSQGYDQLNSMNFPFKADEIEFALITHNHADHMARLPMLFKFGFLGKVYATKETAQLLKPAIINSYQIMKDKAKQLSQKQLYEEEDIYSIFSKLEACELEETTYVSPNVKITYFDNGHLIGAGMILVQISFPNEEDINLLFTGDYKPTNLFKTVRQLPDWVLDLPLTAITESTYGYMETKEITYCFEKNIQKAIQEGKSLLIFVFAQARAQEILYYLKNMQEQDKISKKIPIYLDGNLSHVYTKMYMNGNLGIDEDKTDFLPKNFNFVTKDDRQSVTDSKEQKIILTTSGMADHGPAQIYVPMLIGRSEFVFHFTGYTDTATFGYKLQHPENGKVNLLGQDYEVKAQIFSTGEFSSHAKADELETLLRSFRNLKSVLINHGQKSVKEQFAHRLEEKKISKRIEILGEHTARISHYGCTKVIGAKIYGVSKVKQCEENKAKPRKKQNFCRYSVCCNQH